MTLQIQDEQLIEQLRAIAERENRTVEDVIQSLVENRYEKKRSIESIIGIFDDDVTDMSTTVRETMDEFYRKRADDSNN